MPRVETNRLVIVLVRTLVLPKILIGNTPVVVGIRIPRVETNCLVAVLDRSLILPKTAIGNTPVVVGIRIRGFNRIASS